MSDLFDDQEAQAAEEPSPQQRGGIARAEKLTSEQRRDIARAAAQKRWNSTETILKATHGSDDRPLVIGDLSIPCYVLEDGRRVLSLSGMLDALGMSKGSGTPGRGDRLVQFAASRTISPFLSNDLIRMMVRGAKGRALRRGLSRA